MVGEARPCVCVHVGDKLASIHESFVAVVFSNQRLQIVSVVMECSKFCCVVAHAPHSQCKHDSVYDWWRFSSETYIAIVGCDSDAILCFDASVALEHIAKIIYHKIPRLLVNAKDSKH